jgi:glycosyltransferase involved in cell wall biosynthesis
MKIVVCYKVFNEADYLKESIDAIYDFVDKIVIVEGCLAGMVRILRPDRMTPEGLSSDGTTEIIISYPDRKKKIIHDRVGFLRDEVEMANRFLLHAGVGDYIWMIDGDEIYPEEVAEEIYKFIKLNYYNVIRPARYNLWHDFYHRIIGGGWYTSHPRIFKVIDEHARFVHIATLVDAKGQSTAKDAERVLETAFLPAFFFHPCYVRTTQRILEKIMWQKLEINYRQNDDTWRHVKQFSSLVEAIIKTDAFFTNEHDKRKPVDVVPIKEELPKSLRDHEYAAWKWDESPLIIDLDYARSLVVDVEF